MERPASANRGRKGRAARGRALALVIVLAAGGSTVLAPPAGADSVFSARGLGELVTPADIRGRGMGGVSVAVDDAWNLSRINPALISETSGFTIHAELIAEGRRVEDRGGETRSPRSTNFPLLRLTLPVPKIGVIGVGVGQYADVSYAFTNTDNVGGTLVTQTLRGKNGLNVLGLTYARRVRPDLAVGIDLDFLLGSYVDIWETSFDDPALLGSTDSLVVNHSRGPILRLGVLGRPHPRIRLGAAFTFGRDIEIRSEIRKTNVGARFLPTSELHLPASVALGMTGDLDAHWRLGADLVHTRWETTHLVLGTDPILNRTYVPTLNVTRIAVGAEYRGDRSEEAEGLRQRIPLRLGYAWEPWHFRDAFGEKITEHLFTAGVGIPLPEDTGIVDISFELGYRGDREANGARERILRLGIGFTGQERVAAGQGL